MQKESSACCVVFTICSNNYLAQARTLFDSVRRHNPDVILYLGLADVKLCSIDYTFVYPATVIELNNTVVPRFDNMVRRYNIIEFNTAVKPCFFQHLIGLHPGAPAIYYFDPDIMVYHSLQYLHDLLVRQNIILTPHFYTPLPIDGCFPHESMALKYGVYNLGFLGLKPQNAEVARFLKWWGERTFYYGYEDHTQGLFVDQIWITLVPLFFKGVQVISHMGCNMGPWNLHERWIESIGGNDEVVLNSGDNLIFYHYSSYHFKDPFSLQPAYNRYNLNQLPLLKSLYASYHRQIINNKIQEFSGIPCALPLVTYKPSMKHRIMGPVIALIRRIWKKL